MMKTAEAAKTSCESGDFALNVIETRPPLNKDTLGLPDRDQVIEYAINLLNRACVTGCTLSRRGRGRSCPSGASAGQ